jgi:hypothetical protein
MPPRTARAKAGKSARRKPTRRQSAHRWSARVTRKSDALDLDSGVLSLKDPELFAEHLG